MVDSNSGASAQIDRFIHDGLPPVSQWPEFQYPATDEMPPTHLNLVVELLDKACSKGWADRPLLRSPKIVLSYNDVLDRVNRIAQVLTEDLKLVPGNRVLLRGSNSIGLCLSWLAVVKAGLIAVSTMPLLRASELGDIIAKAQPTVALCDSKLLDELVSAQSQHPVLQTIVPFNTMTDPEGLASRSAQKMGTSQPATPWQRISHYWRLRLGQLVSPKHPYTRTEMFWLLVKRGRAMYYKPHQMTL